MSDFKFSFPRLLTSVPFTGCAVLTLAGLILTGAVACSPQSAAAKPGLDGRWTGYDVGQPDAKCTLLIRGGRVEYQGTQTQDWLCGSFVLNERAQPRRIDLTIQEAGPVNANDVGTTALLIYELRDGELRMAVSGQERPADFTGGPGIHVFSFRRD